MVPKCPTYLQLWQTTPEAGHFSPACAYHDHKAYITYLALVFQGLHSGLEVGYGYAFSVHLTSALMEA